MTDRKIELNVQGNAATIISETKLHKRYINPFIVILSPLRFFPLWALPLTRFNFFLKKKLYSFITVWNRKTRYDDGREIEWDVVGHDVPYPTFVTVFTFNSKKVPEFVS